MSVSKLVRMTAAASALSIVAAPPAFSQRNENGYGPDPDGDTNPATMTQAIARIGASDMKLDPRFTVITFEPPPGAHNKAIRNQYTDKYGVSFSKGLKWQICDDQRFFQYDSLCTYIRPPSGIFAAYYRDDLQTPLEVKFKKPVCAAALSVYPTGGKEGEKFKVTLAAKKADGSPAGSANVTFAWTQNTFRWRVMAGGFFLNAPAHAIDVTVASADKPSEVIHFVMDDLAYIETGCAEALEDIKNAAGYEVSPGGALITKSAK